MGMRFQVEVLASDRSGWVTVSGGYPLATARDIARMWHSRATRLVRVK